ncbi:MAG TPA: carbonic anhydrase, partial [Verrucomicrobiae bacterium]
CIDARLNPLIPEVLGIPEEQFIWLRNAGNIITSPLSSTMRSLALACAVKGAEEICIIGHTDCQVCKTTTMQLLERMKALGIERHVLPENLNEYFGMFASERQNVIKGCELVHKSPLIGPKVPVHGLLLDIQTGQLEWLVNGYQTFAPMGERWNEVVKTAGEAVDKLKSLSDFKIGEMKFPETKIGETVTKAEDWLSQKIGGLEIKTGIAVPPAGSESAPAAPPPPPTTAQKVAEKIVEFAEKRWKTVSAETQRPPPPPPSKIPLPPRIAPTPRLRRK